MLGITRAALAAVFAVGLTTGCSEDAKGPCPGGVCVDDAGGGDGSGGAGDGATGSDAVVGDATSGTDGCTSRWACGPWETDGTSDQAKQTCIDKAGCVSTPRVNTATLPKLDFEYYKCRVQPIADRGCSMLGCHGSKSDRPYRVFSRGRLRNDQDAPAKRCTSNRDCTGLYRHFTCTTIRGGPSGRYCAPCNGFAKPSANLDKAGTGNLECWGWGALSDIEWRKSYDSARAFMRNITAAKVDDSELLKQVVVGGLPHVGVHLFKDKNDPDYVTIRKWLLGQKLGSTCNSGRN